MLRLINIGFGNMIAADRIIAIVSPDSAPVKRMIQEARDRKRVIDATQGRRTRAVHRRQRPCGAFLPFSPKPLRAVWDSATRPSATRKRRSNPWR